ncbi:unnamed protein product [Spirodela intermedia]|uniref:DUF7950 domain-containing protein n=1 Tax=Spirodela intermedia TaxID=51605 RepID=A0A7I8IK66_SPIIN|nr:unnamed protein product [Spirodela intermedia]CAA6657538.1 unnamed protein product [Spirodela intermedia]
MHSIDITRTHEILARYRPIAPRPAPPPQSGVESPSSAPPGKLTAAGLHHLQTTRPVRSKKRGRAGCSCVASKKRAKTYVPLLPSPEVSLPLLATKTSKLGLSGQGFPVLPMACSTFQGKGEKPVGNCADLLTLSLLPFSSAASSFAGAIPPPEAKKKAKETTTLDLNSDPEACATADDPLAPAKPQIIVPQPVRPIGSSISVGYISEDKGDVRAVPASKKPEEVEEEVESEALPAVVSDSNNRIRLANSAYKKMVGQPECSWLDFMVRNGGAGSNRINGEVMLDLSGSAVPTSSNGFSCSVTIEWACNGRRTFVRAPCDVNKLFCESKNYLFAWRFHTEVSDVNCQA